MTLENLIKYLRESILDDTGGTGVIWQDLTEDDDESDQLRWSNEELTTFINEAFLQAHRRALLIKDASGDYDITVSAGIPTYALDSRVIRIKGAKLESTGKQLNRIDIEDLWDLEDLDLYESTPTNYVVDYSTGNMTLYPSPLVDDTVQLLVYRSETTPLSWDTPDGEPDIEERYQIPALNYAAHLAYLKDEANALDPRRSQLFYAMFTAEFSDTSAYIEKRRNRTANRGVRYRDLY